MRARGRALRRYGFKQVKFPKRAFPKRAFRFISRSKVGRNKVGRSKSKAFNKKRRFGVKKRLFSRGLVKRSSLNFVKNPFESAYAVYTRRLSPRMRRHPIVRYARKRKFFRA